MAKFVVDETGDRCFTCADLAEAEAKVKELVGEGRKAYIAASNPHDLVTEEMNRQGERVADLIEQLQAAQRLASGAAMVPLVRGDRGYSATYAAVLALRQESEAAIAKAVADALEAAKPAPAAIANQPAPPIAEQASAQQLSNAGSPPTDPTSGPVQGGSMTATADGVGSLKGTAQQQ